MDHISYSQYKLHTSCPRSWYLSKVRNAEPKQTWYLPIGTAVHDGVEAHLKGEPFDLTQRFYDLISAQMLIEPDLSRWLAGGPKAAPVVEEKALQKAADCYEKALEELEAVEVWEVEYDASGSLPGLEVPVKAYVDILGEHKKKGPVIWDWKTGSTKPDNFQLETYAALLMVDNPWDPALDFQGRYVMLAPGSPNTRYVDLSKVDPREVGKKYQAVYARMQDKHYEANAGFNCGFCFNQDNCLVNAGNTERALYYDRSEDDGYPF